MADANLKFKPGDPMNPYDPASVALGNKGVFDRAEAGQSPLSSIDPAILKDPLKFTAMMEKMKQIIEEDAKERELTGETPMEQTLREKVEWAAQDAKAAALKLQGNATFTRGDFQEAFLIYTACTELSPLEPLYSLNRAAAGLKLKLYKDAEEDAGEAITSSRNAAKPYFRRAQARKFLGKLKAAAEDLKKAGELENNNSNIKAESAEVARLLALPAPELKAWITVHKGITIKDIFPDIRKQVDAIKERKV